MRLDHGAVAPWSLFWCSAPRRRWRMRGAGAVGGFSERVHPSDLRWDHVVAMVAVGLWGAFLGAPAIWLLPVVFPLVMAAAARSASRRAVPAVETGIAASAVCLACWSRSGPAAALARRARGRRFRHLPWPCPRHRAARGGQSADLRDRLRDRDRASASARHRVRAAGAVAGGPVAVRAGGGAIALTGVAFLPASYDGARCGSGRRPAAGARARARSQHDPRHRRLLQRSPAPARGARSSPRAARPRPLARPAAPADD